MRKATNKFVRDYRERLKWHNSYMMGPYTAANIAFHLDRNDIIRRGLNQELKNRVNYSDVIARLRDRNWNVGNYDRPLTVKDVLKEYALFASPNRNSRRQTIQQ